MNNTEFHHMRMITQFFTRMRKHAVLIQYNHSWHILQCSKISRGEFCINRVRKLQKYLAIHGHICK